MNFQLNKEEQEFYKKLGVFIKIMLVKRKHNDLTNNCPTDNNNIKKLITDEMLCHYKKGKSRISFFKLLKLADYCGYNPHQLVTEFVKHMKITIGLSVNCIAQTKVEGEKIKNQTPLIKFDNFADNINSLYLEYKAKRENKGLKFDDFFTWVNTGKFER